MNREEIENKYLFLQAIENTNMVLTRSNEIIRSANTDINIMQKIRKYDTIKWLLFL